MIKHVSKHKLPRYTLQDEMNREIEGYFSDHELVRTQLTRYRSSVIDRKKIKGIPWIKLKWKGYPDEFNSWVKEKDLDWVPV